MGYSTKKMSIFDRARDDVAKFEDARVFFELSTGHSVPDWHEVPGGYAGTCFVCEKSVVSRPDSARSVPEDECPWRQVQMVHDY
jgi:hypothetical protein